MITYKVLSREPSGLEKLEEEGSERQGGGGRGAWGSGLRRKESAGRGVGGRLQTGTAPAEKRCSGPGAHPASHEGYTVCLSEVISQAILSQCDGEHLAGLW